MGKVQDHMYLSKIVEDAIAGIVKREDRSTRLFGFLEVCDRFQCVCDENEAVSYSVNVDENATLTVDIGFDGAFIVDKRIDVLTFVSTIGFADSLSFYSVKDPVTVHVVISIAASI